MAGQRKRLIGRDGEVYAAAKGVPIKGGTGASALNAYTYYIVSAVAPENSTLPAGIEEGYVFKGVATITPAEGDIVIPLNLTKKCDVTNFSIEYSADEIDVTTLCDTERNYRAGFTDATGSIDGITTLGVSEYLANKFLPIVTQTGSTIEVSEIDGQPLIVRLVLNKQTAGGDILSYFAPITITSYNLGAAVDDAQTYTGSFRNTPDNDLKPCLLKEVVTGA